MSNLITNNIQGPSNVINLLPGSSIVAASTGGIVAPGMVVQTVWNSTSIRRTYTSPQTGDGQAISELDLRIRPTRSNSVIYLQWMLFYEMHHDNVFTILRNGSLIGYNTQNGNSMWSGVAPSRYDQDTNSTPSNIFISWMDAPATTSFTNYSLGVRCSTNTSYTFALNRTTGSTGQDSYETGVSMGIAMEIAQ